MKSSSVVAALALAVLVALVAPAVAQSDRDTQAKERFQHGQSLFDDGHYQEALVEFTAAYELSGRVTLLFNMAESSRLGGQPDQARDYYERYLAAEPSGDLAKIAKERLVKLAAAAPKTNGTGKVETPPPGDNGGVVTPAEKPAKPVDLGLAARSDPAQDPAAGALPGNRDRRDRGGSPFYKRWPFWVGVGAVAVAGTAAAIILSGGGENGVDCDGMCQVIDFR